EQPLQDLVQTAIPLRKHRRTAARAAHHRTHRASASWLPPLFREGQYMGLVTRSWGLLQLAGTLSLLCQAQTWNNSVRYLRSLRQVQLLSYERMLARFVSKQQ